MAPAETLTVPTQRHGVSMRASPSTNPSKKSWQSRVPFVNSKARRTQSEDHLSRPNTHQSTRSMGANKDQWWKTKLFSGMANDIRRRAPFYMSDWKDAWDYRVVPATIYMYFAKYVYQYHYQHQTTSSTTLPVISHNSVLIILHLSRTILYLL